MHIAIPRKVFYSDDIKLGLGQVRFNNGSCDTLPFSATVNKLYPLICSGISFGTINGEPENDAISQQGGGRVYLISTIAELSLLSAELFTQALQLVLHRQ